MSALIYFGAAKGSRCNVGHGALEAMHEGLPRSAIWRERVSAASKDVVEIGVIHGFFFLELEDFPDKSEWPHLLLAIEEVLVELVSEFPDALGFPRMLAARRSGIRELGDEQPGAP
jgi:hypothetical protein